MRQNSDGGSAGVRLAAAPEEPSAPTARRDRWVAPTLIAATVILVVGITLYFSGFGPTDFLTYRPASAVAAHGTNLYRGGALGPTFAGQPFTYTPFAILVLLPLNAFGLHLSFLLWSLVSVTVFRAVMARFVPDDLPHRPVVIAVVVALTATTCIVRAIIVFGQINLMLLGLCVADLMRTRPCARPERSHAGYWSGSPPRSSSPRRCSLSTF